MVALARVARHPGAGEVVDQVHEAQGSRLYKGSSVSLKRFEA